MNQSSFGTDKFDKNIVIKLAASAGLAVFWVVFLWNFFDKGPYALGINTSVIGALFLWLFVWILVKKGKFLKSDLIWITPLALIIISFALYDNPFLKTVTLLVWPVSFAVFYNSAFLSDRHDRSWDLTFAFNLVIKRLIAVLFNIGKSFVTYIEFIIPINKKYNGRISKIIIGLVIFAIFALVILIPLLSAADPAFERASEIVFDWITKLLPEPFFGKLIFAIILSIGFYALALTWGKEFDYEKKEKAASIDSIISGIVLGGILVLYLLFLGIQFSRLWVGSLPFDFKTTESLVKSGFWQLFALTVINIFIFFLAYRKTSAFVQKMLLAFTAASLLLLVSAGYRMGLYVFFYGFSYEKFYASYTVLYCALLFFYLISRMVAGKRTDVIRSAAVLFLWMFAVVSVFPAEQFIFRTNMALSQREDSRIKLFELSMLSPDVLGAVKKYEAAGILNEKENFGWKPWIEEREKMVSDKRWYEYDVSNLIQSGY